MRYWLPLPGPGTADSARRRTLRPEPPAEPRRPQAAPAAAGCVHAAGQAVPERRACMARPGSCRLARITPHPNPSCDGARLTAILRLDRCRQPTVDRDASLLTF